MRRKAIETDIIDILKECPVSRYDDMILFLIYCKRCCGENIGNLTFSEFVLNYKKLGVPSFATLQRARQRVQALFPELSRQECDSDSNRDVTVVININ